MKSLKMYHQNYRSNEILAVLFIIITIISIIIFISNNQAMFSSNDEFLMSFVFPFITFILSCIFFSQRISSEIMALKFYNIDLNCKEEVEAKIAELEASEEGKTCNC